jgi:Family of unknown function (DUF6054)
MAHFETELSGDADALAAHLDRAIPGGSVTAKLENGSDQRLDDARMVVRAYERFSALGGNRVALTVSILAVGGRLAVSMVATGGSQAMFFKVNTLGESSFLDRGRAALESFAG